MLCHSPDLKFRSISEIGNCNLLLNIFQNILNLQYLNFPHRPLERVVDLQRNENGYVGLMISDGTITEIHEKSSAENNGIIVESQICEINGINVLGLLDDQIAKIIKEAEEPTIRFTIIPREFYDHLVSR